MLAAARRIEDARRKGLTELNLDIVYFNDLNLLTSLDQLTTLSLSHTEVTDLSPLASLVQLTTLNLDYTQVTDLSPLASLDQLTTLSLSHTEVTDLSPLASLVQLTTLNLDSTQVTDLSPLASLDQLTTLSLSHTEVTDLSPLASLVQLTTLNLDSTQVTDLSPLASLDQLTTLSLSHTEVTDLSPLASLVQLTTLNLDSTQVTNLSPLASLVQLTTLNLDFTQVTDLSPLASLVQLTTLKIGSTRVTDLSPLASLVQLATLNIRSSRITDLSPLASLVQLTTLNLDYTQVTDLSPLASLDQLTTLSLSHTEVTDLSPLASLVQLTTLNLDSTQVTDLSPLASLDQLTTLNLDYTQVTDLSPLASLDQLTTLNLDYTQVTDLSPLASLDQLTTLNLDYTQVTDLSPLASLDQLTTLSLVDTPITSLPLFLIDRNNLKRLYLYGCTIKNLAPELLGKSQFDNCLDAVRSHLSDLAAGVQKDNELKLILLGNGRVGKTSLYKQLFLDTFDANEPSTHSIQLYQHDIKVENEAVVLNVWDFGGQDIYHGTHTLFLKSRSVFLLVWDGETESNPKYEENGLTFYNQPLAYWVAFIRTVSPDSPVIVVQNKCDPFKGDEPPADISPWPHTTFRADTGSGQEALQGHLLGAYRELLKNEEHRTIGVGRWSVKQKIRQLQQPDPARVPRTNKHQLLDYTDYLKLCEAQGESVSSPAELIRYLHNTGVVFHDADLFDNQIILDQQWVIDAIYSLFDRKDTYRQLLTKRGRFKRSDLADLTWSAQGFSDDEQHLFITFMESCGICFRISDYLGNNDEYLSPEHLPELSDESVARDISRIQRLYENRSTLQLRITHHFLHRDALRGLMAVFGREYRADAVYWHSGFIFEDLNLGAIAEFQSTHRLDGHPTRGLIEVSIGGDDSRRLFTMVRNTLDFERNAQTNESIHASLGDDVWIDLEKLNDALQVGQIVSTEGIVLDAKPYSILLHDNRHQSFSFTPKAMIYTNKTKSSPVYISYAWGDDTPEGTARGEMVERLHDALISHGYDVRRDKDHIGYRDSIGEFMAEIGQAPVVIAIVSEKYLKSRYCMHELCTVWRNGDMRTRLYPIVMSDVRLSDLMKRVELVTYWSEQEKQLASKLEDVPRSLLSAESSGLQQDYDQIRRISQNTDQILGELKDKNTLTEGHLSENDFEVIRREIDASNLSTEPACGAQSPQQLERRSPNLENKEQESKKEQSEAIIKAQPPKGIQEIQWWINESWKSPVTALIYISLVIGGFLGVKNYLLPLFQASNPIAVDTSASEDTVPVHRLYNPKNSAFFYTTSEDEMKHMMELNKEWVYGGIAFRAPNNLNSSPKVVVGTLANQETVPVHRLYNSNKRTFFYTTSEDEMKHMMELNNEWAYEGIGFHAAK